MSRAESRAAPDMPDNHHGMPYLDFMARLSRVRDTKRYLEVGVSHGHLLSGIAAETAVGVDPHYQIDANVAADKRQVLLFQETADAFFAERDYRAITGGAPDLVFLDGMHTFEFLLRDFYNAERIANDRTLIVMHDCLPLNAEMAERDMGRSVEMGRSTNFSGYWTGDVWKIIPILRQHRPDLRIVYVDCPPTGLVCVTNLDPASDVLQRDYLAIVDEIRALPNSIESIREMYAGITVTPSRDIMNSFDSALYFRC